MLVVSARDRFGAIITEWCHHAFGGRSGVRCKEIESDFWEFGMPDCFDLGRFEGGMQIQSKGLSEFMKGHDEVDTTLLG